MSAARGGMASTSSACAGGGTGGPHHRLIQRQQQLLLMRHQHQQLSAMHTSARMLAEESTKRMGEVAPVSMRTLILTLMAGAGVLYAVREYKDQKLKEFTTQSQQVVGQASVGGPFELVDQDGKRFTSNDLFGEFALLYFGFTHCPDICPDELEKVSEAVNVIDKWTGAQVQTVFITVDPQRDTPALCKTYVREFHPRMVGLTGDFDNIKKVSKAYRVYFNKTGEATDQDYLVDHSIIHYLVDPEGQFVTFFSKSTTMEQLATQVLEHMAEWQAKHPEYNKGKVLKPPAATLKAVPAAK